MLAKLGSGGASELLTVGPENIIFAEVVSKGYPKM